MPSGPHPTPPGREKSILQSSNRKLERKVKELTIQIDDERQHVNDQKDQVGGGHVATPGHGLVPLSQWPLCSGGPMAVGWWPLWRSMAASPQLSLRVKALKRQVDEAEEEIERLEAARKKAQRELEEQHELNEQLQGRIKALEKEAW